MVGDRHRATRGQDRVAVLGAGIMGCSIALMLARQGHRVVLFDAAEAPFSGASRWNEGKIHLGYLYAGDPSLATARRLLPGGLAFRAIVEDLLGCRLDPAITPHDDLYLVHRDSVVGTDAMDRYFATLSDLVRAHADAGAYLVDVAGAGGSRLTTRELEAVADTGAIRAGFRVPERSVSTNWVADRYLEALRGEPAIEWRMSTRVRGVAAAGARWRIATGPRVGGAAGDDTPVQGAPIQGVPFDGASFEGASFEDAFDTVVNALWEGRLEVDASAGLPPEPGWSHRYRQSLFVRTRRDVAMPSAVVATGPFGDVKNYNGRDLYLSWYPHGLRAEGRGVIPPALDGRSEAGIAAAISDTLGALLPQARDIIAGAESVRLEGGWVFAMGQGVLSDPASGLHRRDRFGIRQAGGYFSVDTGKYSTAPSLARELADRIGRHHRA